MTDHEADSGPEAPGVVFSPFFPRIGPPMLWVQVDRTEDSFYFELRPQPDDEMALDGDDPRKGLDAEQPQQSSRKHPSHEERLPKEPIIIRFWPSVPERGAADASTVEGDPDSGLTDQDGGGSGCDGARKEPRGPES